MITALKGCSNLEKICDFEWTSILLDKNWKNIKDEIPNTYKRDTNVLDLHGKGLGERMVTAVLAELLTRDDVVCRLYQLDIR